MIQGKDGGRIPDTPLLLRIVLPLTFLEALQGMPSTGRHQADKRRVKKISQRTSCPTNARPEPNPGAGLDTGRYSLGQGLVGIGKVS